METAEKTRKIKVKKRGNALGLLIFQGCLRLFGLRGAYGLLYPVCLYYLLTDRQAVGATMAYVRRRFGDHGAWRRHLDVFRLFVSQGTHLIDRHAAISGHDIFHRRLVGYEHLTSHLEQSRAGMILLTAHVGNWQIAMKELNKLGKPVYLVMRPEDNVAVQKSLKIDASDEHIRIISPEQELGGVVDIINALQRGHIVSIMGDRSYGFNALEVDFLGGKVRFPYGPFAIAAATGSPVILLLTAKISHKSYVVDVSNVLKPSYTGRKGKKEQLRPWVQQFAAVLEEFAKRHPYQCFFLDDTWTEAENDLQ